MNAKSLGMLVLVGVVVALLAAGAVFLQRTSTSTTPAKLPDAFFASLEDKVNDVANVRIETKGETISLSLTERGWVVDSFSGYAARFEPVKTLIMEIARARPIETKTNNRALLKRLDLDDPSAESNSSRVSLLDKEGALIGALVVGKTDSSGQHSYVRKSDETQAYTAEKRVNVLTQASQWVDTSIIKLARNDVWAVTITHPDGDIVRLWRETPDDPNFTLLNVPEGRVAKPANQIGAATSALAFLTLTRVERPATAQGPDAAQIEALAISGQLPVTVEYVSFENLSVTCKVWQAESSAWVMVRAASEADPASATEINTRVEGWLYEISQYASTNMTGRLESMLEPAGPSPADTAGPAGG